MATDTQNDIHDHLVRIRSTVALCENTFLDGPVSADAALAMRQQIEGAIRRLQIVRDWLDHRT